MCAVPYLREIIVALVVGVPAIWNIVHVARRSTRLALAFGIISCALATYLVFNVFQVERWIASVTGVVAVSSLIKNLLFAAAAAGFIASWQVCGVCRRWQVMGALLVVVYVIESSWTWAQLRGMCPFFEGLAYDRCSFGHLGGAASEIFGLLVVAGAALGTAVAVRPFLSPSSRDGRAAAVFVAAVCVLVVWALVAAVGVYDIYRTGDLGPVQYIVRTPLALSGALLMVVACLYLPLSGGVSRAMFAVRCRPIVKVLAIDLRDQWRVRWSPTALMDAVSSALRNDGYAVRAGDERSGLTSVAEVLRSDKDAGESLPLPLDLTTEAQHRWLLRLARLLKRG